MVEIGIAIGWPFLAASPSGEFQRHLLMLALAALLMRSPRVS